MPIWTLVRDRAPDKVQEAQIAAIGGTRSRPTPLYSIRRHKRQGLHPVHLQLDTYGVVGPFRIRHINPGDLRHPLANSNRILARKRHLPLEGLPYQTRLPYNMRLWLARTKSRSFVAECRLHLRDLWTLSPRLVCLEEGNANRVLSVHHM